MFATYPKNRGVFVWERRRSAAPSLFRWTHGLINRLVTVGDVLVLLANSLLYPWLDHSYSVPVTLAQTLCLFAIEATVFVVVLRTVAAYRVENYARLQVSLSGIAPGLACAWAAGGAAAAGFAPDLTATMAGFLAYHLPQLIALVLFRLGARIVVGQIGRRALMRRNTIVIGSGARAEAVVCRLTDPRRAADFNVMGVVADGDHVPPGGIAGRPLLGNLTALVALGLHDTVDLVVIATDDADSLARIVHALRWVSADVVLTLDTATARSTRRALLDVAGQPALSLIHRPLKGSQALLKVIEDRVVAAVALVILSPLMLLTALAIRLDSPGAALFRQDRIGLHNGTFRIFKFRTMTLDPNDDGAEGTTTRYNPRITRVGRVLRSLSLDELPQLLNVLHGEMSIVGPRPYVRNMLVEGETFDSAVRSFAARHRMKPGITGLAQASGFRSNALRNRRNAEISVALDLDYIARWSLWLDLRIMVRTLLHGMSGPEVF